MRNRSHLTIPQIIALHYQSLLHETSESKSAFVRKVREHYEAHYEDNGTVEWSKQKDAALNMMRDAEKFDRWLDNSIHARFPAEVMESTVFAFPVERRFALQVELAERQGLLAVSIPVSTGSADSDNLGRMAKEVGEAISAVATMLDDGVIDENDAEKSDHVISELLQAQAALQEMVVRIRKQTTVKGKPPIQMVKP